MEDYVFVIRRTEHGRSIESVSITDGIDSAIQRRRNRRDAAGQVVCPHRALPIHNQDSAAVRAPALPDDIFVIRSKNRSSFQFIPGPDVLGCPVVTPDFTSCINNVYQLSTIGDNKSGIRSTE